jgi:branched-chain amino acid aminotransferase
MDIGEWGWVNGQVLARESAAPSVASSTLHMGTGVFDGIMAYWNTDHWYLHLGCDHLERFTNGCRRMGLPVQWSVEEMELGIHALLAKCERTTQYVRPIAFRGAPEIRLVPSMDLPVTVCIFAVQAARDVDEPLSCTLSTVQRVSSLAIPVGWKVCGAYVNSFLAQTEAIGRGYDTGLLLDQNGDVSEAAVSNIFVVSDERLLTPRLSSDVFPGLTRRLILEIARSEGICVDERTVSIADIAGCDAAFLSSTLLEIRSLTCVDTRQLAGDRNGIVRTIVDRFRAITSGSL